MLDEIQAPLAPEPAEPAPRQGFWELLATIGVALATFVVYGLAQGAVLALFPGLLAGGNFGRAFTVTTLASAPIGIALLLGFARLRQRISLRDDLGLRLPTARQTLGALALLAVFNVSYDQLTRLLHRPLVPDFMVSAYRTAHGLPGLYLAVVVAAPVFEELLFRGFLLPGLLPALGAVLAALLSSVAFALPHLQYDLFDMTSVFVLGLLFAGVRLTTGSTLLTILLHAITNLIATLQVAWVLTRSAG